MKRKLLTICMSLGLVFSGLAVAPVSAHTPLTINEICDDAGYEMTGVLLHDQDAFDPDAKIEFCLQRDSAGDSNIAGASFIGTATLTLSQYSTHQTNGTWQDAANGIWVKDFRQCKVTKNSSGSTYNRMIVRVRVQNSVAGVWDTIYDLQGPVGGDYSYYFSPFPDTADRLLIQVDNC